MTYVTEQIQMLSIKKRLRERFCDKRHKSIMRQMVTGMLVFNKNYFFANKLKDLRSIEINRLLYRLIADMAS